MCTRMASKMARHRICNGMEILCSSAVICVCACVMCCVYARNGYMSVSSYASECVYIYIYTTYADSHGGGLFLCCDVYAHLRVCVCVCVCVYAMYMYMDTHMHGALPGSYSPLFDQLCHTCIHKHCIYA
jgi:hypothetical protein